MPPKISSQEYATRRKKLFSQMQNNSIALVPTSPEKERNHDNPYPYCPSHDFYYLTGFNEPETIAVFLKNDSEEKFILFNRPNRPEEELWVGAYAGQKGAVNNFGADEAFDINTFDTKLNELLKNKDHLYYSWGRREDFDKIVASETHRIEERSRMGDKAPHTLHNIETILHEMRLFKSPAEAEMMRYSAQVDAEAHVAAIKAVKPGMYEYELQAELTYVMQKHGCREYSYTPIVAAGKNACTLHYITNNQKINDGDLILIDAGCEHGYYASDITRCFPANGKFSAEQKAVYNAVLRAQLIGIENIHPKNTRQQFIDAVLFAITEGLVEIGLLQGDAKKLFEEKAYKTFMPHSPTHWLGLDTHDVGNYILDKKSRQFEPGMTLTNEPGIYIPPNTDGVDKKWWGIGVRIEDDILVTENGCDVLSKDVPKTVEEIEALMR